MSCVEILVRAYCRRIVGRWANKTEASRTEQIVLHDVPSCGRPTAASSPSMLKRPHAIIRRDRSITNRQLARELSAS
ncbi:hypothetical protein ANN_02559 [Periplaneta americana]|uniref:Uncharacterized protein n=1 Tax=Periplaneta americana TaxID=6978 RepID=A0ABQ8TWQ9_PERAM|nr:hypothetical protein ANN_02559 [Periplaneta americana]